jgi:hypothetical protein
MPGTTSFHHEPPCPDLAALRAQVIELEAWKLRTLNDIREIRDVVSQVKLLMSLSIGGGGLSILTLVITLITLLSTGKP